MIQTKPIQRIISRTAALLGLTLGALLLLVGTASAAEVYVRTATIGSPGAGNGELSLGENSGVAANESTEDVYVADTGNGRIEQFEADGTFVRVFGAFSSPTFIAIDNSGSSPTGDVYVADSGAGTVSKFAADGSVIGTWGAGGKMTGFAALNGVTVGPDGDLYVLDEKTVSRFDPAGNPVGTPFESPRESGSKGLAIDPAGNLYKAISLGNVIKFANNGNLLAIPDGLTDARALANDPESGDLFVAQNNSGVPTVNRYALNCGEECDPLETFGLNELSSPSGIAIGASGVRYVAQSGASTIAVFTLQTVAPPTASAVSVAGVTGTKAHFSGQVNPNGFAAVCKFEFVTDASFAEGGFAGAASVPCATNPGSGSTPVAVEADVEGLIPATSYHVRLVATNAGGPGSSAEPNPIFTTEPVAPVINGQSVIRVEPTEAILGAAITPGGAPTTYHFEYLDEATFLAEGFASPATRSTPEIGPLPGDNSPHAVSVTIPGLDVNTAYVARAVATNSIGTVAGPPITFKTGAPSLLPAGSCPNLALRTGFGARLPDCRAYEQVTPIDKGGLYVEGFPDLIGAASDGSGITYISGGGTGFPAAGGGRQDTTTFLSSLSENKESWVPQRLMPSQQLGEEAGFLGASRDMRFALVEAGFAEVGTTPKSGLFLIDTANQSIVQIAPYQSGQKVPNTFGYDAISVGGARVFFESRAQLTSDATPGQDNLYMWERATGNLTLVGILPASEGGNAPPGGSFGGAYAWNEGNTESGGSLADLYVEAVNAASPSGDQMYFTAGITGQLYLRRGLAGPTPGTVHVSERNSGVVDEFVEVERLGERFPAAFQEATSNGRRAFFMSREKLTEDASTGEFDEGRDLYRYDEEAEQLVDITAGQESPENPNGAEVLGLLGASSDGSSGYFAARGILAPGAAPEAANIYRFDENKLTGNFALTFVAQVSPGGVCGKQSNGRNWTPSSYCAPAISDYLGKTSRVTPDGQTLVFTKFTENKLANIYIYRVAGGESTCISCIPTGAASVGAAELTANFVNANQFLVPKALPAARMTHNVSDDGSRVFFQTPNSLVAEDTNGPPSCAYLIDNPVIGKERPSCVDVYEWEAPNAPGGSCSRAEVNGGCLYLLSEGKSSDASYFLDASSDGSSAFIATTSQLVPVDRDALYDVYDARIDGGIDSQHHLPGVPCEQDACRGPATQTPPGSSAGSSTFEGPGNPKPKKHHKKKHHKKKHHKKKHKHGANKNGNGGSSKGAKK